MNRRLRKSWQSQIMRLSCGQSWSCSFGSNISKLPWSRRADPLAAWTRMQSPQLTLQWNASYMYIVSSSLVGLPIPEMIQEVALLLPSGSRLCSAQSCSLTFHKVWHFPSGRECTFTHNLQQFQQLQNTAFFMATLARNHESATFATTMKLAVGVSFSIANKLPPPPPPPIRKICPETVTPRNSSQNKGLYCKLRVFFL